MKKKCMTVLTVLLLLNTAMAQTRVAISMNDLSTARTVAVASDVMAELQAEGFEVEIRDAGMSLSQQTEDIRELAAAGPEYLIIAPARSIGLRDVIQDVAAQGIKVIMIDRQTTDARATDVLANLCMDAEWAGRQCAQILAEYFDGRDAKVLEFQGEAASWSTYYFTKGFRDALCAYENMQICAVLYGEDDRQVSQQELLKYIEESEVAGEGRGFDAIFGHGDEEALGVINAYLSIRGMEGERAPIVCIGGEDDTISALAAGQMLACVCMPTEYGGLVVETIRRDMAGEAVEREVLLRGEVITAREAADMRGY